MNQKKVKALKKALRTQGVDINERVYSETRGSNKVGPTGQPYAVTGTIFLKQGCGRQVYQMMKG